ncbi:hypothetical protein TREMEDRAFT_28204, partial [Tremella mesenterica DSM 1558]|uniref:uncharacterized protein n=1 Tax=Tremella mesenterica (strain ATCC 24925 / CBS 8224 / DSM 1558 / NBRC 9311 / NRRL Y-6157 / RJB 2259-6 / UBC 559-6) TaxID=578456 RepID=UPI0003F48D41
RYVPPDFDPRQNSTLNAHQGKKHALGKRAKDIDKGILIVRFELPFNIWCGSCGAHIGAGVRYNAQKKKVGNYYSTPIFGFRCKCHLCSGWFELRTDPKNAAYIVHEGARKKDEDWDPSANGGYAVHDNEAPSASEPPADPFGHVEKTINQQKWAKTNSSRLTELSHQSDRLSSDPYLVSSALRRRFREEKKLLLEKQNRDDGLREQYGLNGDVDLGEEDVEDARALWEVKRERAGLPVGPSSTDREPGMEDEEELSDGGIEEVVEEKMKLKDGKGKPDLGSLLRKSTARKYDPFGATTDMLFGFGPPKKTISKTKQMSSETQGAQEVVPGGIAFLAGYESD